MARLYKARISFDIVVFADSKDEAWDLILRHAGEEAENVAHLSPDDIAGPHVVAHYDQVPAGWSGAIPWGEKRDRKVARILDEPEE